MTRLIGDAYIALLPDASLFRSDADAKLRAAISGMKAQIPITGDPRDINAKISAIAAALKGLDGNIRVGMDNREALTDSAQVAAALEALRARAENIPVSLDNAKGLAELYTLLAGADTLGEKLENLEANMSIEQILAQYYKLEAKTDELESRMSHITGDIDMGLSAEKLAILIGDADQLRAILSDMRANTTDAGFLAKIATMQGAVMGVARQLRHMPADADTLPIEASLFKIRAQVEAIDRSLSTMGGADEGTFANLGKIGGSSFANLGKIAGDNADAIRRMDQALRDLNPSAGAAGMALAFLGKQNSMIVASNAGGWWGAATTKIRLFGGALDSVLPHFLTSVSVWHLAADLILEFAAAWGPALIAVGTFAAYAYPVAEKIIGQWKNINTVIDSVGGHLTDLGGSFDTIQRAIEPSIMIAFGEYMSVIGHNAQGLGSALADVGKVVDVWGAAMVGWAAKAQTGFDSIVRVGAKDFAQIGYGFEQFFRIISSLIKDLPGYVHILLTLGDAFLTVTANVVQAMAPVIKLGLAIHGAMLYIGLAVTGIVALTRAMAAGAIARYTGLMGTALTDAGTAAEEGKGKFNAFGNAIGGFAGILAAGSVKTFQYVKSVVSVGRESGIASSGAKLLKDGLALIPFGGVGLAAAGVAAVIGTLLYFALRHGADAADQFGKSMQNLIASSSIINFQRNIQTAVTQTTGKIRQQAQAVQSLMGRPQSGAKFANSLTNIATTGAQSELAKYQQQLAGIIGETSTYYTRMQTLSGVFGSVAGAQSAMNLAGISAGKISTENNGTWQTTLTELKGLAAGYGYMGQYTGQAANQLATLNIASGTTTKNLQALTQAESAWVSMISGGDNAFSNFEQGQGTLKNTMGSSAKSVQTLNFTLGHLQEKIPAYGATMNGLSASSLAVRQAFDSQLGAGTTLYGNLQTLAVASGNTATNQRELAKAGKDIVAQMLPFAAGSKEATAELYAMAQVAGYTGADSFKGLAKWVGNTKGAEADLNKEQAALTVSAAKLSTAEKNLGNVLETSITAAQGASLSATFNLTGATNNLTSALAAAHGQATKSVAVYAGEYYNVLLKMGVGTATAKDDTNALLHQMGQTPQAIARIDATLSRSVSTWGNYEAALAQNSKAAANFRRATQQDQSALQSIPAFTNMSARGFQQLWSMIQQQNLDMVNKKTNDSKSAFEGLTNYGVKLTKAQLDNLWHSVAGQNLVMLSKQADTTKSSFIQFARNGLGLSQTAAANLWGELRLQYLDTLVAKGDNAKNKFINLAKSGFDLTTGAAENLWNTLKQQYLDTLATKAGETKKAFEGTAGQLGVTKQAADNLWGSLHKLAAGSPYKAAEYTTFSGAGSIKATLHIPGVTTGGVPDYSLLFSGHAAGGVIKGHGAAGQDSVPIMAAPGELIIPASHAAHFGVAAKKAGIPGFASGGVAGQIAGIPGFASGGVAGQIAGIGNITPFTDATSSKFATDAAKGFLAAIAKAAASAAIPTAGIAGNVRSYEPDIIQAMKMIGIPMSDLANILAQMTTESGGNPLAVNNSDSNAKAGTPSTGLMQVIGPTFAAYAGPYRNVGPFLNGVSVNPMANIYAGLNYAAHSYGIKNLAGVLGHGHGYRAGGLVMPGAGRPHSAGGVINEPVYGFGAHSGIPYSFAENGPEQIVPAGASAHGTTQTMQPMTTYQGQAVLTSLGMMVKLLQQMPYAQAKAMSGSAGAGVRHGYYAAQG